MLAFEAHPANGCNDASVYGADERDDGRRAADVRRTIACHEPYRLDLTARALRRTSTNVVDAAANGTFVRALRTPAGIVVARVAQARSDRLELTLDGARAGYAEAVETVRRMLGVERDVSHFVTVAATVPWLRGLAERCRGLRPPRYPTLWEACVNAIVFQQISIDAASAILRRTILACETPIALDDATVYPFPSADRVVALGDSELGAAGLSAAKIATLRRVAEALESGTLRESMLEERSSPAAVALLTGIKGIGPWTATVILLRGLGRLDVFPMKDSGVDRSVALVAAGASVDVARTLSALAPEQGFLYYNLLLGRLEARDRAQIPPNA